MGKKEKILNKVQDLKGQAKVKAGKATNNADTTNEGRADRLNSALKGVKESLKDAEGRVKDVVKREK